MPGLRVHLYENGREIEVVACPGAVEFGRQTEAEEGENPQRRDGNRARVNVARRDEVRVPRRWLLAEPLAPGQVRLTNLNPTLPVPFLDGSRLEPGRSRELSLPVFVVLGEKQVGLQAADAAAAALPVMGSPTEMPRAPELRLIEGDPGMPLQTLAAATIAPGFGLSIVRPRLLPEADAGGHQQETTIALLQAATDVLQSAASSSEFFDKAAAALVDLVGLDSGQVILFRDRAWRPQALKNANNRLSDERPVSRHILDRVLAEKRTFWQVPGKQAPVESLAGIHAVVAAPILDKKATVIGALYGVRQSPGPHAGSHSITKAEALLVELLAIGVAAGMARIEQEQAEIQRQKKLMVYERELEIGRTIQAGFLPETLPQPPGWEIVGHFQPAREVAGDFYDCFTLSPRQVALVMADVCDKGVGSALFMALFRSLIRAFSIQTPMTVLMGFSVDHVPNRGSSSLLPASERRASLFGDLITLLTVEQVNRYVTSNHASACMFATLFLAILDTATGELSYVNAGHDAPTILGISGIKTRLEPTGPAVGLLSDASFDLGKVKLEPGDILLTHTDGVTDARDALGKSFSEKRLLAALEGSHASAAVLIERLVSDLRGHIGTAEQFDDITLLAVRSDPDHSKSGPQH